MSKFCHTYLQQVILKVKKCNIQEWGRLFNMGRLLVNQMWTAQYTGAKDIMESPLDLSDFELEIYFKDEEIQF